MTTTNYPPPLDQLHTLGDARLTMGQWPDHCTYGLGSEHIPDLCHMAKIMADLRGLQDLEGL
jgi:hypothetical protein